MEGLEVNKNFWGGKDVFVTGHTGFKGGWLSLWLQSMGARVHGYSLAPTQVQNFYEVADVEAGMASSVIGDICDAKQLTRALSQVNPTIVFHLAAQPLVRYSYVAPVETYMTNVIGTVNLLEAVRRTPSVSAVVNVTTDKCYENNEWLWGYRESEPMGGRDPYSSSKGCAELVTAAYRQSFLGPSKTWLASARAGNVIGGGDWADDRLIPDFLRALDAGELLRIRAPRATRPWQHVLEPVHGYLLLAEALYTSGADFAEAWNFGPSDEDARSVQWIVENLSTICNSIRWEIDPDPDLHEANFLKLDSSKAKRKLDWQPCWGLNSALSKTIDWHKAWRNNLDMRSFSLEQIMRFQSDYLVL